MMELKEQKFVKISIILLMLVFFYSCQEIIQDRKLECILNSVEVDINGTDIMVGQIDGWTDTTALISIIYQRKSMNILMGNNLKGLYKGRDIYFYQSNFDTLDKSEYDQIPNNITWNNYIPKEIDENIIQPPYDPINVQIEYNTKRNCITEVIKGKGYINQEILSKCNCKY